MSRRKVIGWTLIFASPGIIAGLTLTFFAAMISNGFVLLWRPWWTLTIWGVGELLVASMCATGWYLVCDPEFRWQRRMVDAVLPAATGCFVYTAVVGFLVTALPV